MAKASCMYYPKAMPADFCDYVIKSKDWSEAKKGTVGQDLRFSDIRKVNFIYEHQMSPLGSVCKNFLTEGNTQAQWTDSIRLFDIPQILKYEVDDKYDWHVDAGAPKDGIQRKVSISILLNDPSEFEGGKLRIKDKTDDALKNKGDIIVFDASLLHCVTPITKGVRYSVASWAFGIYEE